MQCEAGCMHFTGGEVKHHRDCPYYPDSLTKIWHDTEAEYVAEINRLRAALEPFTAGCFWDNGDLTVDRGAPSLDDVKHAFWVLRKSP